MECVHRKYEEGREKIHEERTTEYRPCYAFFKDLCTYQELNAMAQRLQVAKMLHEGHVFHEIVEETGASTATISRVNRAIKDGCDGYQIIFDRTEKTEEK